MQVCGHDHTLVVVNDRKTVTVVLTNYKLRQLTNGAEMAIELPTRQKLSDSSSKQGCQKAALACGSSCCLQ